MFECSFRTREKGFWKCILRNRACYVAPERRRICEQNMRLAMAPGAEIVVEFNPQTKLLEKRLAGAIRQLHRRALA